MKKLNNKILAIAFVALAIVFFATRWMRSSSLQGNIRSELVSLEPDQLTEVQIASRDSVLRLVKEGNHWQLIKGENKAEADSGSIGRMIQTLSNLRAKRMASRKKEKWSEYKVDSSATHVSAFYGSSKQVELHIGTLGFNQNPNGGGMNQGIEPYTFVRLEGEDDVYVVDGFLSATFSPSFKEWKKKAPVSADSTVNR